MFINYYLTVGFGSHGINFDRLLMQATQATKPPDRDINLSRMKMTFLLEYVFKEERLRIA